MKKTFLISLMLLLAATCFAQSDPIKFLGIPVDGPNWRFDHKLRAKSFIYDDILNSYSGEFNGENVDVLVHTNRRIVDRVVVVFQKEKEHNLRIKYNLLLKQLQESGKYIGFYNEQIPESDDISYEMSVNKKNYTCSFYYFDSKRDKTMLSDAIAENVLSKFMNEEQIAEYKEKANKIFKTSKHDPLTVFAPILYALKQGLNEETIDGEKANEIIQALAKTIEEQADGEVWFTINDTDNRIVLYYDNLHNQAHGEDL